jgi:hypothetical protein
MDIPPKMLAAAQKCLAAHKLTDAPSTSTVDKLSWRCGSSAAGRASRPEITAFADKLRWHRRPFSNLARYVRLAQFSFLILIGRFVTLDAWSVQEPHTHAPHDDRGQFRCSRWRQVTQWRLSRP